ncbi:Gibberellin 20 oxidase 1-B [Dichanthelium oligosanthes]|uniref:Gibberellin 20 oxidase 1-B n=1 Tax=Dichanthelium oligosanthes TaxID=888268 RepID=A0A1E5UKL9_9POAL|nr:Gibberellin 20 oxidase 1-B [Dichanthelium oligosanthes]
MAAVVEFEAEVLSREERIPAQFVWPAEERAPAGGVEKMDIPVVDLAEFLRGGCSELPGGVAEACERHGFFQVVGHGVGAALLAEAYRCCDAFYARPLAEKQRARRRPGESHGYASSFTGRFECSLPWKETLSFHCPAARAPGSGRAVVDYFVDALGEDYRHMGEVYQEYCNEMTRLALDITEVLAAALGLGRGALRGFFDGGDSLMRLNNYPPCRQPHLTLGTGPHRDPTSVTLLHQDDVGGLQVRAGGGGSGGWRAVRPRADAFVVNIGDTFAALTDGRHASCLHRAVVSSGAARRSLAFFLNPRLDRVVRPPDALLLAGRPRAYPDFTWREFLEFTQKHYRSDASTLDAFVSWIERGRGGDGGQDHGGRDEKVIDVSSS